MSIDTPVLLLAFNRPETTQLVFNSIKRACPKTIYFSVDGPRPGIESDIINCQLTRDIVKQVDWDCEVNTNFLNANLGCAVGVSSGIAWAFKNEDRMIILEDDTVPAQPFFHYCDRLLEKFKDDTRICMISGDNYTSNCNSTDTSYFFSYYGHIWGWATWKRAWKKFDLNMIDWNLFRDSNQILNIFPNKKEQIYFLKWYNDFLINKKHTTTWDYQWFYCRFKEAGLSIIPRNNLVTNIGVKGAHTNGTLSYHFFPVNENFIIEKEPGFILRNVKYDNCHFKNMFGIKKPLLARVWRKCLKVVRYNLSSSESK
jgi:hypothetical protein